MKNRNGKHSSSLHPSKSSRTNVYIFILGSRQVGKFSAPPVPTSPQKKYFFNFPRKVGNISHHTFPTVHNPHLPRHSAPFCKKIQKVLPTLEPHKITHKQSPANLTKSHTNKHPQTTHNTQTSQNHTQTNIRKPHKITHKQTPANHPQTTHHTQITRKPSVNHIQTTHKKIPRKIHTFQGILYHFVVEKSHSVEKSHIRRILQHQYQLRIY